MAVFLTASAGRVNVDVTFDRLRYLGLLGINYLFAVGVGSTFPFQIGSTINTRLGEQFFNQFTIGAFKRAYKSTFL